MCTANCHETETEVEHNLPRNVIIGYHGGGYDGCIFEWNFVYIDKDGGFHELFTSGCLGITTAQELEKREYKPFVADLDRWRRQMANPESYAGSKPDRLSIYEIDNDGLTEFTDSESINSIANCAEALANFDLHVKPVCSLCKRRFAIQTGHAESMHGSGGVHVEAGEIVCEQCHSDNTCSYCGEFYNDDKFYRVSDEHKFHPESGCCKFCVEQGRE